MCTDRFSVYEPAPDTTPRLDYSHTSSMQRILSDKLTPQAVKKLEDADYGTYLSIKSKMRSFESSLNETRDMHKHKKQAAAMMDLVNSFIKFIEDKKLTTDPDVKPLYQALTDFKKTNLAFLEAINKTPTSDYLFDYDKILNNRNYEPAHNWDDIVEQFTDPKGKGNQFYGLGKKIAYTCEDFTGDGIPDPIITFDSGQQLILVSNYKQMAKSGTHQEPIIGATSDKVTVSVPYTATETYTDCTAHDRAVARNQAAAQDIEYVEGMRRPVRPATVPVPPCETKTRQVTKYRTETKNENFRIGPTGQYVTVQDYQRAGVWSADVDGDGNTDERRIGSCRHIECKNREDDIYNFYEGTDRMKYWAIILECAPVKPLQKDPIKERKKDEKADDKQ